VDLSHADDSLDQTVHNCEVIWYTRKNPETGVESDRLSWKARVICYLGIVPDRASLSWEEISVRWKTSAELLEEVEGAGKPLSLTESVAELDALLPIQASNSSYLGSMI